MKSKSLWLSALSVFGLIFVTDFLVHGVLLSGLYAETESLWRPQDQMQQHMPFMFLGQALTALFFAAIFNHGYKGGGMGEGVRYGLLISGFIAAQNLMMYAVAPYPSTLVMAWVVSAALQSVFAGMICVVVHRRFRH